MLRLSFAALLPCILTSVFAQGLTESSLEKHVDSLVLDFSFGPVKDAYWTGYPHHRRTPFAVSPDGSAAYLAYLDASETNVHVQQVDPKTFAAVGSAVTVAGGKEAGGLVAHDDGFALLTNEALPSGTSNAPADSTPVPVLYRYTNGQQSWKTYLGGPGVHEDFGLVASPDMNGDLVFSEEAGLYGAYFVVTAYTGSAAGHFGDSIQYVAKDGSLQDISGASSSWGCSHNTGIAFEAADAAPFASICAEDQGAIWLNTQTQTMNGVKISNENTTNGGSGEPMGGMSGSYSGLARLTGTDSYVFAWVSRGAKDLTVNDWLGDGFTHSINRTNGRNVAIAQLTNKSTLDGEEATSQVDVADGDSQVNWITQGTADNSNAHVAAFNSESVLVTWEEIAEPQCDFVAMGCRGAFTGAYYQLVTNGKKVGEPVRAMDTFVAGDMVTMSEGRVCWPYVAMDWDLSQPVAYGGSKATTTKMSFACMNLGGSASQGQQPSANPTTSASPSLKETTDGVPSTTAVPRTAGVPEASSAVEPTNVEATTSATPPTSTLLTSVRTESEAASTATAPVESADSPEADEPTTSSAAPTVTSAPDSTETATPVETPTSQTKPHRPCDGLRRRRARRSSGPEPSR
ncbi:hypothetical protein DL770_001780 [Monosporascus sp. CRB-9-2]|nr:hypothetical protein DL770_001780 [Monosporascus sp. CRB-9-2]